MTVKRHLLIALAILALGGVWLTGSLDRPLSSIGLNHHECARNGLGVTFCGKELAEYRGRVEQVKAETAARQATRRSEEHERAVTAEREASRRAATLTRDRQETRIRLALLRAEAADLRYLAAGGSRSAPVFREQEVAETRSRKDLATLEEEG